MSEATQALMGHGLPPLLAIVVAGGIAWLFKRKMARDLATHKSLLAGDLETHKANLERAKELELANLRHEFEKRELEHRLKHERLAGARHEALIEIYGLFLEMLDASFDSMKSDGRQHINRAIELTKRMQRLIDRHGIFLPEALCKKWRGVTNDMFGSLIELDNAKALETPDRVADRKQLIDAVQTHWGKLAALKDEFIPEIRHILGVEDRPKKLGGT